MISFLTYASVILFLNFVSTAECWVSRIVLCIISIVCFPYLHFERFVFFFSPSSFFVDFSVDFSLLFNVLGSSSFSKQGFQFFASKFSIFSSGFLCVWSSDIRFFIKTVHNSILFSYYYLKPGNQLYFCFLESVTFNQGFLTLPAATTFVVNALLHKLLSDPYLS